MTMRPLSIPFALAAVSLAAASARAQACPDAQAITRGMRWPLAHVRYLADDALQGRLAGTASERCAGDYVAAQFRALGLQPAGDAGTYFQSLPLA
ncbi:MAG TPA: hypothetical protein VF771_05660, partial [Longimicrobiaceae bacterium]